MTHDIAEAIAAELREIFGTKIVVDGAKIRLLDTDNSLLGSIDFADGMALVEMRGSGWPSELGPAKQDCKTFDMSNPRFPDSLYEWSRDYWQPAVFLRGYKLKALGMLGNPGEALVYFVKNMRDHPILSRTMETMAFTLLTINIKDRQSVKDWIEGFV